MEKRSGYKECPRCGLRNKPSVAQCDFCGWQFEESQDEWIDQIRALEKISTDQSTVAVDEELSKRIKATIIKPDEVSVDDFVGEQDRSFMAPSEPTPSPQPVSGSPTPENRKGIPEVPPQKPVMPEREYVPEAVSEPGPPTAEAETESAEVAEFVESMIEETAAEGVKEPEQLEPVPVTEKMAPEAPQTPAAATKKMVVEKEAAPEAPLIATGLDLRTAAVPAAVLASGVAAYVGILLFSVLQPVHWTLGWTMSIAGAIMVTVGCSRLYDVWKHPAEPKEGRVPGAVEPRVMRGDKGVEVFICPLCNEVVSESDDHCPNCGVEFEKEKS